MEIKNFYYTINTKNSIILFLFIDKLLVCAIKDPPIWK